MIGDFIAVIIIIITAILMAIPIINYMDYKMLVSKIKDIRIGSDYRKIARLKWDMVLQLYNVEPKRWKLNENIILYNGNQSEDWYCPTPSRKIIIRPENYWRNQNEIAAIILSYPDYKRWLHWKKQEIKRKKQQKEVEGTAFVLQRSQLDIDRLKEQVHKEIEQANKEMKEIVKGLRV